MPASTAPSTPLRVLAALAGGLAFLGVLTFTLGLALTAALGMVITAAVLRSRGRPFTRMASWLGAVSGVAATVVLVAIVIMVVTSDQLVTQMQAGARAEREREPTAIERAIERMQPRTPASSAMEDAMEERMEDLAMSGPFLWATVMLSSAILSALAGLLVGSAAWACVLLMLFGTTGRWPPGRREQAEAALSV